MTLIDLNADSGESLGNWTLGDDNALLAQVSSASTACGFHAGDPTQMRRSVAVAKRLGLGLGAHPGYPDLLGFGRRELAAKPDEIADYCLYQVGALAAFAAAADIRLQHVKPHGALYVRVAGDPDSALAVAEAMRAVDPSLILVLPPSPGADAARTTGVPIALEAYVDLDYDEDGLIVLENPIRAKDPDDVADRAVQAARGRIPGSSVHADISTICLHGDGPNALELAQAIRRRFDAEGIEVAPLRAVVEARAVPASGDRSAA